MGSNYECRILSILCHSCRKEKFKMGLHFSFGSTCKVGMIDKLVSSGTRTEDLHISGPTRWLLRHRGTLLYFLNIIDEQLDIAQRGSNTAPVGSNPPTPVNFYPGGGNTIAVLADSCFIENSIFRKELLI